MQTSAQVSSFLSRFVIGSSSPISPDPKSPQLLCHPVGLDILPSSSVAVISSVAGLYDAMAICLTCFRHGFSSLLPVASTARFQPLLLFIR
jgi:hypothetical protein